MESIAHAIVGMTFGEMEAFVNNPDRHLGGIAQER